MNRALALLAAVLVLSPAPVRAALEPFVATYDVLREGRKLGEATMQLSAVGGDRWRVDLVARATGVVALTGFSAQQSTVFTLDGDAYRPLTQSAVRSRLFSSRRSTGVYDWAAGTATWTGDVKKTRRAPVPLQAGDMSGLLINLAVIRDAAPGATLRYRFVDDGRARDHVYEVAPETEPVAVDDLAYSAMRVRRVQAGDEETVLWVAAGVPTPVRILQRDDGADRYDLRLTGYQGAP
ncbi:DUF3108 domain-containing protein [Tolypothrix campylonemoides VB511288]|nr:DUF3108 domain-containing protein [Tolypothrix campylonemoides VB511288]